MKGYEAIKELLESELDSYGYFSYGEIKIDTSYGTDEDEYYVVDVKNTKDEIKTLSFHYSIEDDELEIDMAEENFERVTTYDWRVKYFWMALLKW